MAAKPHLSLLATDHWPLATDSPVQVVHDPMKGGQMNRFDHPHGIQRNVGILLSEFSQLAAVESRAAESLHTVIIRPLDRPKHIRAVARPADSDEQITGASQVLELFDKHALEAFVIAPGKDV